VGYRMKKVIPTIAAFLTVAVLAGASGFVMGRSSADHAVLIREADIGNLRARSKEVSSANWVEVIADQPNLFIAREQSLVGLRSLFFDKPTTVFYVYAPSQ